VVSVASVAVPASAFSVDESAGAVTFAPGHVPSAGAAVRAGFEFDVPVRFDTDRIEVNLAHSNAGRIPAIPLTEIQA
jgi:uncharacterized protein (TIGR02217 family)